jgi:hypothetical protein
MTANAHIAAIEGDGSTSAQTLFADAVARWRAEGVRVVGFIEEPHGLVDRTCTGGILCDVATGARYPIYRETLPEGAVWHIDPDGAQAACAALLPQIAGCDIVVLSKFGKLEAAGAGLPGAFHAAVSAGRPVLTAVSRKHRVAWRRFAPDAVALRASSDVLRGWKEELKAGQAG